MIRPPRIVITRPRWPRDDHFWKFWSRLNNLVQTEYCDRYHVETYDVAPGLAGKRVTEHYIRRYHESFALCLAHHIENPLPNAIDYKMSYYPNLFYFANGGYNGFSNICDIDLLNETDLPAEVYDTFYTERICPRLGNTKYAEANNTRRDARIPTDYILIPLQVENDTVMALKTIDTIQMIQRAAFVANNLGIPIVIKVHPKSPKRHPLCEYIEQLDKQFTNVIVTSADIRKLLDKATAIFVINSGVGFEAMCRFKPVFTFGRCDYQQNTFQNLDGYQIINALKTPVDPAQTKRFLYNWWSHVSDLYDPDWQAKIKSCIDKHLDEHTKES